MHYSDMKSVCVRVRFGAVGDEGRSVIPPEQACARTHTHTRSSGVNPCLYCCRCTCVCMLIEAINSTAGRCTVTGGQTEAEVPGGTMVDGANIMVGCKEKVNLADK